MIWRHSRLVGSSVAAFVLAGCGLQVSGAGHFTLRPARFDESLEANKARLAKRLIVGFAKMPDATRLGRIEAQTGTKHVKSVVPLAMAVFEFSRDARLVRRALLASEGVEFVESELVEREVIRSAIQPFFTLTDGQEDPNRKDQWYLDTIGAAKVWQQAPKLKTVVVGLVDTGVDLGHPDLMPILVEGWNAAAPGTPPQDQAGHGTMTAGCVAAAHNNGIAIAGTAPNAKIMPIKVGNSASSVVEAMMWAADHAQMVSMSLSFKPGMPDYPSAIETTKRAAQYVMSKNVPMICSMGNTGNSQRNVPSAFAGHEVPDLVAVGATDSKDKVTNFSTFGNWTSVAAPGRQIMTTLMGGGVGKVDGTSFSTPITAGVVAMMLGVGQAQNPGALKARLQSTALDIESPGVDEKSGAGRIDAYRAVME